MLNKIFLTLEGLEFEALLKSAVIDLRDPKEEARFLLRQELGRRGLLDSGDQLDQTAIPVICGNGLQPIRDEK